MNDSDKKEFAEIMLANGDIYNKEISKSFMQAYFTALSAYSISDVKKGIGAHALDPKHGTFFPKPADIVRHLQTGKLTTEEKAELSWAQIEREIRKVGSWGKLELDDKQGLASLKAFTSWKDLCSMDLSKMTWAKKEFISMYSTYENTPAHMLPSSLPGRVELAEHKEKSAQSMQNLLNGIEQHKNKLNDKKGK